MDSLEKNKIRDGCFNGWDVGVVWQIVVDKILVLCYLQKQLVFFIVKLRGKYHYVVKKQYFCKPDIL